ncbi:MAG: hypothetical protein ACK4M3_05725 [Pyrobaculum sp.]
MFKLNIGALYNCVKMDEKCVKEAFDCEKEIKVGRWRADLKCGELYVEVENVKTMTQGLCQVLLWSTLEGVPTALALYGTTEEIPHVEISKVVKKGIPVVYIDIKTKNVYYYV